MKNIVMVLSVFGMIGFVGCSSGGESSSVERTSKCSTKSIDDNVITTVDVNTSGSIVLDCETETFSIAGADSMVITNRIYSSLGISQYKDGSSWEGSENFNEADGTYEAEGSHTLFGDYNCTATVVSSLPMTIDNSDSTKIEESIFDYDISGSGPSCPPDWVNNGILDINLSSNKESITSKLTDSDGKTHLIKFYGTVENLIN